MVARGWWRRKLGGVYKSAGVVHVCSVDQSCPALGNPLDCSPQGSSGHGILQAGTLDWVACPPPGDLPDPGIESMSPVSPGLQVDSLSAEPSRKPNQWA